MSDIQPPTVLTNMAAGYFITYYIAVYMDQATQNIFQTSLRSFNSLSLSLHCLLYTFTFFLCLKMQKIECIRTSFYFLFNMMLPQEKTTSFVSIQTFTYFDIVKFLKRFAYHCFNFEAKAKKFVRTGQKLGFFFVTCN